MKPALLAFILSSLGAAFAADAPRPNILLVLTDDVGWGDPGCYNSSSKIPTPAIDKLAAEGMRFTHAHTPAALCAPTRYSMLTGNLPWRGRAIGGTWGFNVPSQILPGQKTVAQLLKSAGYRTAMFGKAGIGGFWGMAPGEKPVKQAAPLEWGFDYSYLIPRGHQSTPLAFFENGVATAVVKNGRVSDWDASKVGETLLGKAVQFLNDHHARHKHEPFYLHFCTDGAHGPYAPAESLDGKPLKGVTKMTSHTDMIYQTDILLGALIKEIEKLGMREKTLVIYTSDNGGLPFERSMGHDSVAGLRGNKSTIFEGGHRVPFIASWPGTTPAGTVRKQPVGTHDTVATALELAGVKTPQGQALDSVSLAPVLRGQKDDSNPVRKYLFTQSSPGRGVNEDNGYRAGKSSQQAEDKKSKRKKSKDIAFAAYDGDWKLIMNGQGKAAALYDLSNDLAEEHNVLDGNPEIAAALGESFKKSRE